MLLIAAAPPSPSKAFPRRCAVRQAGAISFSNFLPALVNTIARLRPPSLCGTSSIQPFDIMS